MRKQATRSGFTIVELLIVIVVIAILAAITIVAFSGIAYRAKQSAAAAAAEQAAKKVVNYSTDNAGQYPPALSSVGIANDTNTVFEYSYDNTAVTYCVTATFQGVSYYVSTGVSVPTAGKCSGHTGGIAGPWTQIGMNGGFVACGLYNNVPYCWGSGSNGALGNGSSTDMKKPTAVTTTGVLSGKTVTAIDAGGCVIANAAAYCWGYNASGRVGDGTTNTATSPVAVDTSGVLSGKTITKITADNHTCVLASGAPYCWGNGTNGELGNNTQVNSLVPVAVDTTGVLAGKTITDISAGAYNTCVIANGLPYCWGYNLWGANGTGTSGNTYTLTPVAVSTAGALNGKTLVKIKAGSDHVCALGSDGAAYCWGGMCASINGTFTCYGAGGASSNVPVKLDNTTGALTGKSVAQVATSFNHSCVVTTDGGGYCWGYGVYGRLGTAAGTTVSVPTTVDMSGVLVGKSFTEMAVGQNSSCGIASGQAYCWGRNLNGEIGDNTLSQRSQPVMVINP